LYGIPPVHRRTLWVFIFRILLFTRLQVEVNSAKAAMYDDAHGKAERLSEQVASAAGQRAGEGAELLLLREERRQLQQRLAEQAHAAEMLVQDKAYLTRECQVQEITPTYPPARTRRPATSARWGRLRTKSEVHSS
jgi:hypothetical protein